MNSKYTRVLIRKNDDRFVRLVLVYEVFFSDNIADTMSNWKNNPLSIRSPSRFSSLPVYRRKIGIFLLPLNWTLSVLFFRSRCSRFFFFRFLFCGTRSDESNPRRERTTQVMGNVTNYKYSSRSTIIVAVNAKIDCSTVDLFVWVSVAANS